MSRPVFHSITDLGMRDVGVANQPRRMLAHLGAWAVPAVAAAFVFAVGSCVLIGALGRSPLAVFAVALAWTTFAFALSLKSASRSPVLVVRVSADGRNRWLWMTVSPFLLLLVASLPAMRPLTTLAIAAMTALMGLIVWRARRRLPEVLGSLRDELAPGERVLGDGLGLDAAPASRRDAFRVVAATDRRLLAVGKNGVVLDVPYADVDRFGIAWELRGRYGRLSLVVGGTDHAIKSLSPANLLSIAQALRACRVHTEDADAIDDAQRGWEEALQRTTSRRPLLDRAAMRSKGFDRGLWLLLGVSALFFYVNPLMRHAPLPALAFFAVLCGLSGYVSGTRASLVYVAPLDLLLAPSFFFLDAGDVVVLMLFVDVIALVALWVGSALRSGASMESFAQANRLNAPRLTRIAAIVLAGVVGLVVTASAAGFQLISVPLAVQQALAQKLPVDGRSDLTGGAASFTYTPGPGLKALRTDEHYDAGPDDGARWELRSSFTQGYNVVSLAHYIFEPHLDDPAAVAAFVAKKDREHARLAGHPVTHTERVVDGRRGYVWTHDDRRGYWHFAAWFPQPIHTVRVECIARHEVTRFKRLCAEAMASLRFRG